MRVTRLIGLLLAVICGLTFGAVALGQALPEGGQLVYTGFDGRFSRVYNLLADVSRDIDYRLRLPNRTHSLVGWLSDRRALFYAAGTYAILDIGGSTRAVTLPQDCNPAIPAINNGRTLACRTTDSNILVFDESCLLDSCSPRLLHLPRGYLLQMGRMTLAPGGEQIALEMEHDASPRLVIMDVGRDEATAYIDYGGRDDPNPAWSPDGQQIAFFDVTRTGVSLVVFDVADGRERFRQQIDGFAPISPPTWSPDSAHIAFYQIDSYGADIYSLDVADGTLARLVGGNGVFVDPTWSPGGGQIAFYTNAVDGGSILVLDMLNNQLRRVGSMSVFTGG
ncbi:MAG: PD40 domain-containing protein, partial [Anaerolineae bacterium]|nr:PD40 domain-containing protein [Anaerolineae bacterium]